MDSTNSNGPEDSNPTAPANPSVDDIAKESNPSVGTGKTDPAWAYFALQKDGKVNVYTCLFCTSSYRGGGINRMKQHLAGVPGQISSCRSVPYDVSKRMKTSLQEGAKKKTPKNAKQQENIEDIDSNELIASTVSQSTATACKRKSFESVENYFAPRTTPGSQPSLKSVLSSKEAQHKAKMIIAEWAIVNCIPFKTFDCPLFQKLIDAIVAIGPGFKGPTAYDFRINLLRDWKRECELVIEGHRAKWKERGCTLMADGWTDVRQRTLINFLVYSTHGMVFVKSVDASNLVKDAKTLFSLFCEVIDWVGPTNIVHVVTDNAANYVACGSLIKQKYKSIYWTPCAAHCLNLVLKDIAGMPHVSSLATKASKITVFAYNHMVFLSWLRKREGWKEIVRPGATRFATTFITLHSIAMHKHDLQALVVDKFFVYHKLAKTEAGRVFSTLVLDNQFWDSCFQIVKIVSPLIKLLRIVDSDEKPSLPYVYEGMRRAKKSIKEMFRKDKNLYKPYTRFIQARWDKHLKNDLHAVAYLLNPALLYSDEFIQKHRVMRALIDLAEACSKQDPNLDNITLMQQVGIYRERQDSFDSESCVRAAKKLDPCQWWMFYGGLVPELQNIAMRVLSQTSSSSGCERNWSLFERIHTKRRNRLQHERLNDLVYTNYNLRLKNRNILKKQQTNYDPVDIESIDNTDFFVVEEETTPEFDDADVSNLESASVNQDIGNTSTFEIWLDGEEKYPSLNDDADDANVTSAFGVPSPIVPPNASLVMDLNANITSAFGVPSPVVPPNASLVMDLNDLSEVNENFGTTDY